MSKQIEYQINRLLTEFGEADLAADQMLRAVEKQSLARQDIQALSAFLFYSGFHKAFLAFLTKCLEKDRPLAWHFLAELTRYTPNSNASLVQSIIDGAEAGRELEILAQSNALDGYDRRMANIRANIRSQEQSNYKKEKQNLLDQIRVFRQQNNLEVELNLILKFQRLYPKDPDVSRQYTIYLERKARAYLEKRKHELPIIFQEADDNDPILIETIYSQCHEKAAEDQSLAMDFALLFVFIGDYDRALKLAFVAPEDESRNWLIAELMLLGEKYAEALDWILILETRYAHSTETPFAVSYLRALAYHGLGQIETALAVIEGLLQARPGYRLTETLYQQWNEELQ